YRLDSVRSPCVRPHPAGWRPAPPPATRRDAAGHSRNSWCSSCSLALSPSPPPWRNPVRRTAEPPLSCRSWVYLVNVSEPVLVTPQNRRSVTRRVIPQDLVQLQLQTHGQIVADDPVGQRAQVDLTIARREQHLTRARIQPILDQLGNCPVVVFPRADDELDLIVTTQMLDIGVKIAADLAVARGFQLADATDPLIDLGVGQRPAGFQRHFVAGVTQTLQKRLTGWLSQRLPAGDADIARLVGGDALENRFERHDFTTAERVGGIAVLTAQGAAGQAYEHSGQTTGACLPLQRVENLGYSQGMVHISHGRNG